MRRCAKAAAAWHKRRMDADREDAALTFSLRGRLLALWLMSLFAFLVVGGLIIGLYRQSAAASLGRDRSQAARACEAIQLHYRFYTAGAAGSAAGPDPQGLRAVVTLGLRRFPDVNGAIADAGVFLTTAPPAALRAALGEAARDAIAADHLVLRRSGGADPIILAACPLGTENDIAAVTYIEMSLFGSVFSRQALAGLAVLLVTLLASAWYLARLLLGFSRRLSAVEAVLQGSAADDLPMLPATGERELDRLITALNAATARLKAAQARVAQAEKLAALGRMAAGLAHEIRNPLGAIRLRAESAMAGDDARRQAALARVLAEAARLEDLTGKLLGFAAAPAPHPRPCTMAEFLDQVAAPLREQETAKSLTVAIDAGGITALIDPALTARALDNLLRNAIEACDSGGRIDITAREEAARLVITVADTGPGVPERLAAEIFEPFVTGRLDGTGLGLSIAREMIRAQGGEIALLKVPRGAAFRISLPGAA
jgi:signal transduction histidine kinase